MKRIIVICCLFLILTGCKSGQNYELQLAREVAQEIMDAVIEKDEELLFSLLSQNQQNYHKISEQIQEAFDFIDGEIISYELPTNTLGGGKVLENGKVISENIRIDIKNVETNSGKKYHIIIQYFLIFKEDINVEGIRLIRINLIDDSSKIVDNVTIGYNPSD
jgi:hypothetical protein